MTWQGGLQKVPGFKHVPLLKHYNRPFIQPANLLIGIPHLLKCFVQWLALEIRFAGLVDESIRMVSRSERIVAQGPIGVAVQFGNVSEIIQSERVVGIEQVGLIEELLRLFLMPMLQFGNTLAIELLAGRGDALPRNRDTQIAGERQACSGKKLHHQNTRNRTESSCFGKVHHGAGIMMCESAARLTTANTLD